MSVTAPDSLKPSPWLSVWRSPRDTIERIVAVNPKHHVLLLAALLGAFNTHILFQWFEASFATDLGIVAMVAAAGAIVGVIELYLAGLILYLAGRILGGRASPAAMRAVWAWGRAPLVIGLAIWIIELAGLKLSGSTDAAAPAIQTALWISTAILIAVGIWATLATVLMFARVQKFGFWRGIAGVAVFSMTLSFALAFFIRTLMFQPFNIPSGSMVPTLLVGDYFFVSKFTYGYSRYSLPFAPPLFSGRIFASQPRRGDIVVFNSPKGDRSVFVKRIVGLPGDRIQMIRGELSINGTPVKRERIGDFVETDESGKRIRVKQWRLTLPNGVSYAAIDLVENGFLDNTPVYDVPAGNYFVLGDNLDNSVDSRMMDQMGYVPFENLIGPVGTIFWSIDQSAPGGQSNLRSDRIGMSVQ